MKNKKKKRRRKRVCDRHAQLGEGIQSYPLIQYLVFRMFMLSLEVEAYKIVCSLLGPYTMDLGLTSLGLVLGPFCKGFHMCLHSLLCSVWMVSLLLLVKPSCIHLKVLECYTCKHALVLYKGMGDLDNRTRERDIQIKIGFMREQRYYFCLFESDSRQRKGDISED